MRVSTRTARSHIRFYVVEQSGLFSVDTEWRLTRKRAGYGVGNDWFDTPEEAVQFAAAELQADLREIASEEPSDKVYNEAWRLLRWLKPIAEGFLPGPVDFDDYTLLPVAGEKVEGLKVRPLMLTGVREVPFSLFPHAIPPERPCARTQALISKINNSGEIDPLYVLIDDDGPYVLEGAHRFDALLLMGKKSFPAKVLINLTDKKE